MAIIRLHLGQAQGSTFATTNSSGAFTGQDLRHAYGRYRGGTELGTENRFTGQKLDGAGLMYFNARYYDPELGQFLSPDTLVPDPTNLFAWNRYMYTIGNPLKYNDPTGHCIAEGQEGWDSEGNSQCRTAAANIAGIGGLDYIQRHFGGYESVEQWLNTAMSDPNLDLAFLQPHADPLHQQWCASSGLSGQGGCGGSYLENPVPPSSNRALLDELLTACPATFQGVCGVSTGVNGAWGVVGGRGSLDAYLDDKGNRLYTWTAAIGPQLALRPLPRVSGSNSYILASAAKLDDFTGPAISLGGSGSFKRGAGGDVIIGSNGVVGYSLSTQSGYNAEGHVFGSYSGVIYDSRH